jgi:hypothetical protein
LSRGILDGLANQRPFWMIDFAGPDKVAGMSASLDFVNANAIGVHLEIWRNDVWQFGKAFGQLFGLVNWFTVLGKDLLSILIQSTAVEDRAVIRKRSGDSQVTAVI